jgi:transposase
MAKRYELHEWQWQLFRDLFPPPKATGRKRRYTRQMLDTIFWIGVSFSSVKRYARMLSSIVN